MGVPELSVVAKPRSLAAKLVELYRTVDRIPKRGYNTFHKYHYPLEADVVDAMRKALAELNVVMLPSVTETRVEKYDTTAGKKEWLTTLVFEFEFCDGDSDQTKKIRFVGQGSDPGDKGAYKATTGAVKYAILKQALVPTGDDPEGDENTDKRADAPRSVATASGEMRSQIDQHMARNNDPRPSPPLNADAQTGEVRQPPDANCPNYGRGKGKQLSDLNDDGLRYYEAGCLKTLADPSKSNYHAKETALLASIRAWIAFRS